MHRYKSKLIGLGYGPPPPKVTDETYPDGSLEARLLSSDNTDTGPRNAPISR